MSANDVDLSRLKTIKSVSDAIEKLIKSLPDDDANITVTFARQKQTFKVLICQRAGTKAGNKGSEAALGALEMVNVMSALDGLA